MITLGIIIGYFFIGMFVSLSYDMNDKEHAVGFGCIWPILLIVSIFNACMYLYKEIQKRKYSKEIRKHVIQQILKENNLSEDHIKFLKLLEHHSFE